MVLRGRAVHTKYRVFGVIFIVVIIGLLWLTILMYNKAFVPVERVTLQTDRSGNQLTPPADVKLRGIVVGEVRGVDSSGDGATLDLAINPELIKLVPSNVSAQLLPKTLFGEKFVDLVIPDDPSSEPLKAGDVIGQDRSTVAIELQRVLNDSLPLLRAVEPAKLSMTLNALATALEGRGEVIGRNIDLADAYFTEFNKHLPQLETDIKLFAQFAKTYAEAAPDLLRILANSAELSDLVVEKKDDISKALRDTSATARTLRGFLVKNEDRIITLARVSRPTLQVLKTYSPEYPCMFSGLVEQIDRVNDALTSGSLHLTVELIKQPNQYHYPDDLPEWGPFDKFPQKGSGANGCFGVKESYSANRADSGSRPNYGYKVNDGVSTGEFREGAGGAGLGRPAIAEIFGPPSGWAGSEGEQQVISALLAPTMGLPADEVPDLLSILLGPALRGAEVSQSW